MKKMMQKLDQVAFYDNSTILPSLAVKNRHPPLQHEFYSLKTHMSPEQTRTCNRDTDNDESDMVTGSIWPC